MSNTVWVSRLPDDVYFWYVTTDGDIFPSHISDDNFEALPDCERAATEYALSNGCYLQLYDDPDGSRGRVAIERAIERDERKMQQEAG